MGTEQVQDVVMNVTVKYCASPSGSIIPVSSKSLSNRALIIHALAGFSCRIRNLSDSEDTVIMSRLLKKYRLANSKVELNAGMAGTVMRFLAVFCCLGEKEVLLTGSERMLQRPMRELVEALNQMGASVTYADREGFAPLLIRPAKVKGGKLQIDAGVSSQFISALMLCAPYFEEGLELELLGQPVSYSYILLTKNLMEYFGGEVRVNERFIHVARKPYHSASYTVEGDWSSAGYFYALAALSESCQIELRQMNVHSLQGDKAIVDMTAPFGVETIMVNGGIVLQKKNIVSPSTITEDFLMCPDMAQTMAVLCAGNKISQADFSGLSTLGGKETDRIMALESELKRFGVSFYCVKKDFISFDAREFKASPEPVKTWNDHRMAMAFAPLAQKTGTLTIEDGQVVQKSYPRYWEDLKTLGCLIENSDI